jgi:lipoprotein Spr
LLILIEAHRASPYELVFAKRSGLSRGSGLILAGCLFLFAYFAGQAFAAPDQPSETNPPGCAVAVKALVKAKPQVQAAAKATPPAKVPLKSKTTAVSKGNPKAGTKAAVAAKTVAKAQAITAEISPALPENLENEISKFFGISYRLGGEGSAGIDCSALVKKVYSDVFGISLPVFFGQNRKKVNHVGMYLAGGNFLHAARSEGVTISKLDESYWKSRFMFSKRFRGLELVEEPEDVMGFEKDLARDSAAFAFSDFGAGGMLSTLEAGVRVNDSLELALSGFFQRALLDSDPSADSLTVVSSTLAESKESEGGFRLAAILSPSEWFKITPSVTQIDSAGERSGRERDQRQKIGLESWMVLPSTKMAVFLGAHASNQENLLQNPTAVSPDWQTLNFALGLHYTLSDSLRLSLWGTHAYTPDAKPGEDPARRSTGLEDVSIQLDVKF